MDVEVTLIIERANKWTEQNLSNKSPEAFYSNVLIQYFEN